MSEHKHPYIVGGSYFTYKGVRYGVKTRVKFSKEFYSRAGTAYNWHGLRFQDLDRYYQYIGDTWFVGEWRSSESGSKYLRFAFYEHMQHIDPDKDIVEITRPIYYYDPPTQKDIRQKRLKNGTWFLYIWDITLWYILALLVSPIFTQWYVIWTSGTYVYLRFCWIRLSTPEKEDYWL